MKKQGKILVVGSNVMDLIVTTPRFPQKGETVLGTAFRTAPGGKGANQAVQAARLGAKVTMLGRVGQDSFGTEILQSLSDAGVDTRYVLRTPDASTAVGNVQIEALPDGTANNRIIVVSGANMRITPEDVAFLKDGITEYDMVMLQYEIPMEINCLVARYAYEKGVPVMLNTAPSAPTPDELLRCVTYISPNEHEAQDLCGIAVETDEDALRACKALHMKGARNVIITRGDRGAALYDGARMLISPCVPCEQVADPTAAGDSFIGAYCTAICAGADQERALRFANFTAHITVSRMGAQPSLPYLDEVLQLMNAAGENTDVFQ